MSLRECGGCLHREAGRSAPLLPFVSHLVLSCFLFISVLRRRTHSTLPLQHPVLQWAHGAQRLKASDLLPLTIFSCSL